MARRRDVSGHALYVFCSKKAGLLQIVTYGKSNFKIPCDVSIC